MPKKVLGNCGVPRENHRRHMTQVTDKHYHIMLYGVHLVMSGIQTHNVIDDRHQLPYDHDHDLA